MRRGAPSRCVVVCFASVSCLQITDEVVTAHGDRGHSGVSGGELGRRDGQQRLSASRRWPNNLGVGPEYGGVTHLGIADFWPNFWPNKCFPRRSGASRSISILETLYPL